jgi:hypothetical protein
MPERRVKNRDSEMMLPATAPYVRVEPKPSIPRFASEVADAYPSGFGSQSLNPIPSTSFEPLGAPAMSTGANLTGLNLTGPDLPPANGGYREESKREPSVRVAPEDAAIGGFLADLATSLETGYDQPATSAQERHGAYGSREEEDGMEHLDIPAFMRNSTR